MPAAAADAQPARRWGPMPAKPRRLRRAPSAEPAPVKVKSKKVPPKFRECTSCIFYCLNRINAACNDCDAGENFEERVEELRPGRDTTFRKRDHDDFE